MVNPSVGRRRPTTTTSSDHRGRCARFGLSVETRRADDADRGLRAGNRDREGRGHERRAGRRSLNRTRLACRARGVVMRVMPLGAARFDMRGQRPPASPFSQWRQRHDQLPDHRQHRDDGEQPGPVPLCGAGGRAHLCEGYGQPPQNASATDQSSFWFSYSLPSIDHPSEKLSIVYLSMRSVSASAGLATSSAPSLAIRARRSQQSCRRGRRLRRQGWRCASDSSARSSTRGCRTPRRGASANCRR